MRELFVAMAIVLSGLFVGCASMPISNGKVAEIVLNQLDATLASVEGVIKELNPDQQESEAWRTARIIYAASKPQIIAWIDTIEALRGADDTYVADAKSRMAAIDAKLAE